MVLAELVDPAVAGATRAADPILYVQVHNSFLSRVTVLTRYIDIAILSVRRSPRHVSVFFHNGLTSCHSFFTTL